MTAFSRALLCLLAFGLAGCQLSRLPDGMVTLGDPNARLANSGGVEFVRMRTPYPIIYNRALASEKDARAVAAVLTQAFDTGGRMAGVATDVGPFDVAAYVEALQAAHSAPGVKQQLAAVRMLFNWLMTGQVVPASPASAVRGPKHVVKTGKAPVLEAAEWRRLIDAIPTLVVRDLRDRALIATLTYSFARIGAALKMKVEDLQSRGSGWLIRLHEKGGKQHAMPCHHALAEALHAYIAAAEISDERKGWLFRTARSQSGATLSDRPISQPDAWRMILRRSIAAGITAPIGNHSFQATGITAYLSNDGTLEHAQEMAAQDSPQTTTFYDRMKIISRKTKWSASDCDEAP